MDWPVAIAQWLHIFFGVFWFGGALFSNFVLVPAILTLPQGQQMPVIGAISARADRIVPWVAAATILLGIVRGTVLGPIKDAADLNAGYGLYWLIGLIAAVATFAWGYLVLRPAGERFSRESTAWSGAPDELPAELVGLRDRLRTIVLAELLGFLVVFTTMIFMHDASEG